MNAFWIWLSAGAVYGVFRWWHDNRHGPLRPDEIERMIASFATTPGADVNDIDGVRRFLAEDDGREFFMLNLIRTQSGEIPHPVTGAPSAAPALLREYIRGFLPVMVRHAGYPVLQARKIGGYVDAWNVPPDPGWTLAGAMRYRSRRDMLELTLDPRFTAAHPFKIVALAATASFPVAPGISLLLGPRVWVGLVLALVAALLHLAIAT